MKELIKKLEKNKEIQLLLKSFEEEFENNFEIADDIDEFSMITYRDTIFRIWLFSPIVEGTYMSPYYIINRIAQSYKKGDYSIAPHIKIIIKANNINFETKWNIYSKVENPVMDDLNKLAKHCNPTIVKRESNRFVIDGGETFIDEISYRSGYYIDYLLELSLKLNIIKEIKSIGCQCYQLSELYSNYDSLSNEEKINKIIKASIEISNKNLEEKCKIKNSNIEIDLLKNDVSYEDYDKYMAEIVRYYEEIYNNISNLTNIGNIEIMESIKSLTQEKVTNMMANKDFSVFFDINFTIIFGYYLGIINPIYEGPFFIEIFNKIMQVLIREENVLNGLFNLQIAHNLTPFGMKVLEKTVDKNIENSFKDIPMDLMNNGINFYIENKEEILEEYMDMFEGMNNNFNAMAFDFDEDDDYIDDEDMTVDLFGEHMSREIVKHLVDFYEYLFMNKKLKEKTADKHCENVELYISDYLNMRSLEDLNRITKNSMHIFMLDWFIPNVATSASNVRSQLTSLSQYIKFLSDKGFVDKSLLQDFKEISKNKEKYVDYFDEYIYGDDEDIF